MKPEICKRNQLLNLNVIVHENPRMKKDVEILIRDVRRQMVNLTKADFFKIFLRQGIRGFSTKFLQRCAHAQCRHHAFATKAVHF